MTHHLTARIALSAALALSTALAITGCGDDPTIWDYEMCEKRLTDNYRVANMDEEGILGEGAKGVNMDKTMDNQTNNGRSCSVYVFYNRVKLSGPTVAPEHRGKIAHLYIYSYNDKNFPEVSVSYKIPDDK
jgi:hypothetical protein